MKKILLHSSGILAAVMLAGGLQTISVSAETPWNGWYEVDGAKYWYENGVRQGTTGRGKEIYDPSSDAWYWLDASEGGKMATNKDVYLEEDDKWVRYDENGQMIKGETCSGDNWYRFDMTTGAMIKGWYEKREDGVVKTYYYDPDTGILKKGEVFIDGVNYMFDPVTGVGLDKQWYEIAGAKYWYEGGRRQGTEGRGKEIYDPSSDAWYWLDANQQGKMAVSKDVYQESDGGKWVRYDEHGHMVKGFHFANRNWYYFNEATGAMQKGWYSRKQNNGVVDTYYFDQDTGVMQKGWYNETLANGTVNTYYFDPTTGIRVQGLTVIDGVPCAFDNSTGIAVDQKWRTIDGGNYWYEGGKRQGTEGRGKEIYDPASDAWYWLDANEQGKMAVNKDVYQESDGGKWVRYDQYGHMVKGAHNSNGSWYYFDEVTGAMRKGWYSETLANGTVNTYYYDVNTGKRVQGVAVIDGVNCAFDDSTGIALDKKWRTIDGANYWYEGGKRQGTEGRGKEIYDAASDYWYWLDADSQGAMAVNKDVYQDTDGGKWVRYDQYGHMVKGWSEKDGKTYYFDPATGARVTGTVTIDGIEYTFNKDTGVLEKSQGSVPVNYVWDAVKCTYKLPSGLVDYYVTKEYDDKDRLFRDSSFYANGRVKERTVYGYDNDGNVIRETYYGEGGVRLHEYHYTYDSKGRKEKMIYTDVKDSSKSYSETFTYDGNGNLKEKVTYNGGNTRIGVERYYYNTAQQLLQKSIYTVNNGSETYSNFYTYRYDDAGRKVEEAYYKPVGTKEYLVYRDAFEYDRAGNCRRYTEYNANNQRERYTDYIYFTYQGKVYETMVMTYKDDGSVISGYEYEWNGSVKAKYTKYVDKKAVDYYTIYDTSSYPSDRNVTIHTTTDYTYNGNGSMKQIVETEYRLNSYGD